MERRRALLWGVAQIALLALAAGCSVTAPPGSPAATVSPPAVADLNPVTGAGLSDTVRVEISQLSAGPTGAPVYVQRLAVSDAATIGQMLAALNADLKPLPKAACIPEYELVFRLANGSAQRMAYSCSDASFLRGEQPFFRGQDLQPPPAFDALLRGLLAAAH